MRFLAYFLALLWSSTAMAAPKRVITLSPHLTEWMYSLDAEDTLVGVSAYSDFPPEAASLPVIADYNGANLASIMALKPDLILAWQGGNKPQDIARLQSLGYPVFLSSPTQPADIAAEIRELGRLLEKQDIANRLADTFDGDMAEIQQLWANQPPVSAFYYMWHAPLMTVGKNAWATKLLAICHATNIFDDSAIDYPQVSVQEVLRRQPDVLVSSSKQPIEQDEAFWQPHRNVLSAPIVQVNPDITSRFTLRLPNETKKLCDGLHN